MATQSDILAHLPDALIEPWQTLREQTVGNQTPLTICMAGAFSVGKSSLVNMLMGRQLLETALDETTALPTFLEYGDALEFGHGHAGRWSRISEDEFRELSTTVTEDSEYLSLAIDQGWLRGFQLVDLPGLGGNDVARRAFARSQIAAADVIVYMLAPRGPTSADLEQIKFAHQRGKHLKILVSQWDLVEQSVQELGQKRPDLAQWAEQISDATGFVGELLPVSIHGAGRGELLAFFDQIRRKTDEIRQERFAAEAKPLLGHAIEQLNQAIEVANADTDEEIARIRADLRQKRGELLQLRSEIADHRDEERTGLSAQFETARAEADRVFQDAAQASQARLFEALDADAWAGFITEINDAGGLALKTLIEATSDLHAAALDSTKLSAQWESLAFQFPVVELPPPDAWYDAAHAQRLQEQFEQLTAEIEAGEAQLPASMDPELYQALLAEITRINEARHELAHVDLPTVERVDITSGMGATLGRMTGEIADIALMFVNPQIVATKVASVLGKGATAVKVGKAAGELVHGAKVLTGTAVTATGNKFGEFIDLASRRFGFLEKLSLGYWGERLGEFLEGSPQTVLEVDPAAKAARDAELQQYASRIAALQGELEELHAQQDAADASEYAMTLKKREKARVENNLEKVRQQAAQAEQEFEHQRRQRQSERIRSAATLAVDRARQKFAQQARGLEVKLFQAFATYWETHMDGALSEHQSALEALQTSLEATPERRVETLEGLQAHLNALKTYLSEIDTL